MSRWVRLQTSVFSHEIFPRETFSQREAWIWLIANVAWKDTTHRVGNTVVEVPAGSLLTTLRNLQKEWGWGSDYRVRSFLNVLENQRMVSLDTNAGKTQITLCNYGQYQNVQRAENACATQAQRTENASATHKRNNNTNTPIHQSSSLRSEDTAQAPKPSSGFAEFWNLYPNKVGKPVAEKAFSKALQRSDLQTIMAGLHRYVSKTDDRPWCNPSTWLNQDRWADSPVAVPARSTGPPPRERTILDAIDDFIRTHDDELPAGKTIDHYGGNSPANAHLLAHAQRGRR